MRVCDSLTLGSVEVSTGPRALDDRLDHFFNLIPVTGMHGRNLGIEEVLDILEHQPLISVGDKSHGDSDASETAGTTDTMKVGLAVRLTLPTSRFVEFGDILGGAAVSVEFE